MVDDVLADLKAEASIHGHRVNLTWTWTAPGDRPNLRLLRRRRAYPRGPEDGLCVLELADFFREPDQTWARVERTLYLGPNMAPERGLRHAEVTCYFTSADGVEPARVTVTHYDPLADVFQVTRLEGVTRVEKTETVLPPWERVETLEIFATPGGGPEVPVGQIVVSTGHQDGATPNRFEWIAPGDSPIGVVFHRVQAQAVTATLEEVFEADSGNWRRRVTVEDAGLDPEVVYYYAVFAFDIVKEVFYTARAWRAATMATGRYGLDERLYGLLPGFLKRHDEPTPGHGDEGPLRRLLQVFGLALDQVRSQAEGLRGRHDVLQVRADRLPHLARWIGWELDQTLDELAQREEILFAPELYRSVGAIPNLRALVNHITGWDCEVKEFVHNVFRSNAPETIRLWEIWERRYDGGDWGDPLAVTQTDGFDGRPVAIVDIDDAAWLFWHADRSGRREIWTQRLDDGAPAPQPAIDTPDDATYTDEYPAAVVDDEGVWLFWDSDRGGSWDIWGRAPGGQPERLTDHPAEDRHPAAILDNEGQIWLFWQSNRRGPTDIWAQRLDSDGWSEPQRVTTARFRHEMPAALVDGEGDIWLFWSADLGDRRNLYVQILEASDSGILIPVTQEPEPVTEGPQRDETPAAVLWNGEVWLFWHANRGGRWQIWGRVGRRTDDSTEWDAHLALTSHVTADKEPAAIVDGDGKLRLFWRSQRRGQCYLSRTIDTDDTEMMAHLGTLQDRAYYTYDTGRDNDDWYAQGTVGVYLRPDAEDSGLIIRNQRLIESVLGQFLPVQVRSVFIIECVDREYVYTYDFPDAELQRLIGEQVYDSTIPETYFGLRDSHPNDVVPGWVLMRAWGDEHPEPEHFRPTVDFTEEPVDTRFRTWHVGLEMEDDPWT